MEGPPLPHPLMEVRALMPLVSSAAFWLLASLLVGLLANQLPERWLGAGSPRATLPAPASRWGGSSRKAGLLHIRGWKRWIPDAGGALPGGVRKASLVQRDPAALRRLLLETRRAEIVHWLLWPAALLTALWLPPAGVMVNLAFASLFNLPCVLVQRYNRGRLQRCLARMVC